MTRTELKKYAEKLYESVCFGGAEYIKVTVNSEIYFFPDLNCGVLRSYNSIVGIYSCITGTFYAFGIYSNTTVKHIYKAAKLLKASRLAWLCVRSDYAIETYIDGRNPFKGRKWEIDNLIKFDWSMEIETKWKVI